MPLKRGHAGDGVHRRAPEGFKRRTTGEDVRHNMIVTADQHGTSRPQGSQCDIGAIEADYVFVDDFE